MALPHNFCPTFGEHFTVQFTLDGLAGIHYQNLKILVKTKNERIDVLIDFCGKYSIV